MRPVSPIFVRPVREQLEHDRLIRHLQPKYKRKFEVAANQGDEQLAPVKIAATTYYPDLVLTDGKKLAGIVEIETGESVNNLEAMYQWGPFSKARVPFHLYVPVQGYDAARRLIDANHARITEVWTYRPANDGFDLVRMSADPAATNAKGASRAVATIPSMPPKPAVAEPKADPPAVKVVAKAASAPKPAPKPAPKAAPKPVAKPAKPAPKAAKTKKPAAPPKSARLQASGRKVGKPQAKSSKPVKSPAKGKKGPAGRKGR
jgi:hypothetical protein